VRTKLITSEGVAQEADVSLGLHAAEVNDTYVKSELCHHELLFVYAPRPMDSLISRRGVTSEVFFVTTRTYVVIIYVRGGVDGENPST
jgi:hypothetical protein